MLDMTYDAEADAAYLLFGKGKIVSTREVAANVNFDFDANGRIVGVEVLSASRTLVPGAWSSASPIAKSADAAE